MDNVQNLIVMLEISWNTNKKTLPELRNFSWDIIYLNARQAVEGNYGMWQSGPLLQGH
jgi:hypothetical protein